MRKDLKIDKEHRYAKLNTLSQNCVKCRIMVLFQYFIKRRRKCQQFTSVYENLGYYIEKQQWCLQLMLPVLSVQHSICFYFIKPLLFGLELPLQDICLRLIFFFFFKFQLKFTHMQPEKQILPLSTKNKDLNRFLSEKQKIDIQPPKPQTHLQPAVHCSLLC